MYYFVEKQHTWTWNELPEIILVITTDLKVKVQINF